MRHPDLASGGRLDPLPGGCDTVCPPLPPPGVKTRTLWKLDPDFSPPVWSPQLPLEDSLPDVPAGGVSADPLAADPAAPVAYPVRRATSCYARYVEQQAAITSA
eukprot:2407996-Pyramimonas_sp.AAC.1